MSDAVLKPFAAVEAVLQKHLYEPDLQGARLIYASSAAHKLPGAPVWPMLIAPPGSSKTVQLEALDGLPGMNVHLIDKVTPQTFISGQIPDPANSSPRSASLLVRIGSSGIIVAPDFSTLLSGNRDNRNSVFSDLRRIYDGQLRKEYGTATSGSTEWKGRLTFVAAVTPAIDQQLAVFQDLGERFIQIRLPRASGVAAAEAAMTQNTKLAKDELKAALTNLFAGLPPIDPRLPDDVRHRIAALAEFGVHARTHVARSSYDSRDIIDIPESESATRFPQQLAQLAKGSALLDHRDAVDWYDYELIKRGAFDCFLPTRRKILQALIAGQNLSSLVMPGSTRSYATEELRALGLMDGDDLSPLARDLLTVAGYELPPPVGFRFKKAPR